MKKNVIFDLDGTLWDTKEATYKAFNNIFRKYNYGEVSLQKVYDNFGNNRQQSIEHFLPSIDFDLANKILDEVDDEIMRLLKEDGGNIYNGVDEVLNKLYKEYELYIVSNNAHKGYIEIFIKSGNYERYFKDYIAASELKISKGDAIKKIINDNIINEAVYIGDTNKDMEAAAIANIPFIQCLYGFGNDLNCKYKIEDISKLNICLDKIFSNC